MNKFSYGTPIKFNMENGNAVLPEKIQLLRSGVFISGLGDFEIDNEMISNLVKNFQENTRGVDLAIDINHNSDGPAMAWIKNLFTNNDDSELWAQVEWSEAGKEKIQRKEYKYLSSEFSLDYQDNETGESYGPTLFGGALTNRPFIKGMTPVFLSEKGADMQGKNKDLENALEELKTATSNIKTLNEQLEVMKNENKKLSESLKAIEGEKEKLAEEKKLAEKKAEFDLKLSEGKVVEAQREAFMKNDMEEFIKNQGNLNLNKKTSVGFNDYSQDKNEDCQVQILKLSKEKMKENKSLKEGEAILEVLNENQELKRAYYSLGGKR